MEETEDVDPRRDRGRLAEGKASVDRFTVLDVGYDDQT